MILSSMELLKFVVCYIYFIPPCISDVHCLLLPHVCPPMCGCMCYLLLCGVLCFNNPDPKYTSCMFYVLLASACLSGVLFSLYPRCSVYHRTLTTCMDRHDHYMDSFSHCVVCSISLTPFRRALTVCDCSICLCMNYQFIYNLVLSNHLEMWARCLVFLLTSNLQSTLLI